MKYFLIIIVTLEFFTFENVMASSLSVDPANSIPIQGFAPDPYATVLVKGPSSQMFYVKSKLAWQFINTGNIDCIARILPSKDKMNFPKFPLNAGERITYVVHKNTAFLNISGCTGVLLHM
jgi:hypothetical protein